ncbi:probable 39S ribosomal protein L45, mitochondrial [Ischnura elegans]|uniref:probable 39S ribosomal protein L45, mitochondrial n=1 Tax=Ischnura elegans TaxID=197161 RepID=UPI001ED8B870|nr:probable 39S ribosomal protein L45, mitochondrial [Ischnura elegans]
MAAPIIHNCVRLSFQNTRVGLFTQCVKPVLVNVYSVRHGKHWNPKFKKLRRLKVAEVDLRDWNKPESEGGPTPEEIRARMKERGVFPPRPWSERPICVSCTGAVFEPYVPPEGDGKVSLVSVPGAKQKLELLGKKSKSMMAVRKIRSFDEDFETKDFVPEAAEIYKTANECMASRNKLKLREIVTERAYPEIMHNTHLKTIHWKFLDWLEPPKFTHARCTDVISKENIFGQITVRFHSQQLLAIYDRFGRLMYGSETVPKDVLEYVVFEKHLSNQYGVWRLHDKIIPEWMPPRAPAPTTYIKNSTPADVVEAEDSESGALVPQSVEERPAITA